MEIKESSYKGVNFCLRCGGRMLLAKDREKKLRSQCSECGWTYYKNPIPAVACVVVNEANELLIIKRLVEPKPGFWALPSGYVEINQSPEDAAVEELHEETGLVGEIREFLGYYDGTSPIYEKVLSFGFWLDVTGGRLEAGDDAGEAKFVAFSDLPKLAFDAHTFFVNKILHKLSLYNKK